MATIRRLGLIIALLLILTTTPAHAADTITADLDEPEFIVWGGEHTYTLTITPRGKSANVYALWMIDENIQVLHIDSTMPCAVANLATILCHGIITDVQHITIVGLIRGPGAVTAIVGDGEQEYYRATTTSRYLDIDDDFQWVHPPSYSVIYLPIIRG